MIGCYIHIPFCNSICSYCDFSKIYYNSNMVNKYLDSLEREIDSVYRGEVIDTIYIGGGTPSCLSINDMKRLFKIINKFNKNRDIEFSVECNFDSISYEKLDLYKSYGVNRLSFGLESIDHDNLMVLGRDIDTDRVRDIIKYARGIGFNNINIDLMYAISGESIEVLNKDIDFILSLDLEHISTYSLMIEDHTILGINGTKSIDEELDYNMYKVICSRLEDNNYIHYEISNFCRDGYFSRHNSNYWDNGYYYGFGMGASGYIDNKRVSNTRSINKYLDGKYIRDIEYLDKRDTMEYEVILNLRKRNGIDLDRFYNKYKCRLIDVYDYRDLVRGGLLIKDKNSVHISCDKWYISNWIIVKLLGSEVK